MSPISRVSGSVIEKLREQLMESQTAIKNTEEASAALEEKILLLQTNLEKETDVHSALDQELEAMRVARAGIGYELEKSKAANKDTENYAATLKEEMRSFQATLTSETDARSRSLRSFGLRRQASKTSSRSPRPLTRMPRMPLQRCMRRWRVFKLI
jgi:chromosome segregation ATPase